MTRRLALCTAAAALVATALPATAAARPAKEPPRQLTGNAVITHQGIGPIKLNMTLTEARKAARRTIAAGQEITKDCRHDRVFPRRFGLDTLRFKTKIRVLYVSRTAMPTRRGIRVNDTLERLQNRYPSGLIERPSDVAPDTRIFELHGKGGREIQFSVSSTTQRIFQIATGLRPEVDFSEGCA